MYIKVTLLSVRVRVGEMIWLTKGRLIGVDCEKRRRRSSGIPKKMMDGRDGIQG